MKFINRTGNTVYAQEIDRYIPYQGDVSQYITPDELLKSKGICTLILMGKFEVVEYGDSRIESNLERVSRGMSKLRMHTPKKEVKEDGPVATDLEVCIKGHFLEGGGYAKVNRNLAFGLSKLGVNVKVDVVGGKQADMNDPDLRKIASMQSKPSRNAIRIDSVVPTLSNVSPGRKSILYTTVESYSVPKQFVEVASMYDEVWVTSDFCKQVLNDAGVTRPIFILPDSVDTDLYKPKGDVYEFRPRLNEFKFISVFGWSYRKGYDVLLKAYLQEFSSKEPVSLLIVSKFQNNPKRSDVIKSTINDFIDDYGGEFPPHIARCSRSIPEAEMPTLYRACDAFVLPTRGEGFCLPYCEASLCGLPVIGTRCSGQTMFLNDDNSYLVEVDRVSKMPQGMMHIHYWDGQMFPSLTRDTVINDLRHQMRTVYEDYTAAKRKNKKLQRFVRSNYSIDEVASMAKNRLDEIWREK